MCADSIRWTKKVYINYQGAMIPEQAKVPHQKKSPASLMRSGAFVIIPGGDLLSHTVTRAVPSAQRGLTSVFGMGTG